MKELSRRMFNKQTLGSLLTYSLLETLSRGDLFADAIRPVTARWLADLHQLGLDVKGSKLKQIEWQQKVEELLAQVDLPELMRFLDFEKLAKQAQLKTQGELSIHPKFPAVEGLPTRLVFGHQVFVLGKGRSVAPHGHDKMATAFLILDGEFHGRHYDRLQDEKEHMIIKPTIDRRFVRGEYSTVSDEKDNVHWFKTTSDTGFIFNIHVMNVRPGRTGRVYIDPDGEKLAEGSIRAKKITADEAYRIYG